MAEDLKPTEVHPSEPESVDADQGDENVAVLMPSPSDPQADKPTSNRQHETQQSSKPLTLDFKWTTDLIAIIALVLSVFSLGFSYLTVVEMRKTNELTRATLTTSQRAWVTVTSVHLETIKVGSTITVTAQIQNTGQSPAQQVSFMGFVRVDDYYKPSMPHPMGFIPVNSSSSLMSPATPITGTFTSITPLTDTELAGLKSGELRISIVGRIDYKDIFNVKHLTIYCYASHEQSLGGKVGGCTKWNEAVY